MATLTATTHHGAFREIVTIETTEAPRNARELGNLMRRLIAATAYGTDQTLAKADRLAADLWLAEDRTTEHGWTTYTYA